MAKWSMALLAMMAIMVTAVPALAQEVPQYTGEEFSVTGVLREGLPQDVGGIGTHSITDDATGELYALRSAGADLASYEGQQVTIYGALTPGEEGTGEGDGTLPSIDVTSIAPAGEAGEGSEVSVLGAVTSISGSVVLVEEDPSAESGDKGYFTVTDETEITKQEDGQVVPAAFEELEVGQSVEAIYAGAVAESYPTQGNAGSIAILDGAGPTPGRSATLSFELAVECDSPAGARFFGNVRTGEGGPGIFAELLDPDSDGLYTGVATLPDRFAPGPAPEETEPVSLPVQIVQGAGTRSAGAGTLPGEPTSVVEDFGVVPMQAENTFSASVSFCDELDGGPGWTTGFSGGKQYEDGGTSASASIDLNEDGVVSEADDEFAVQTSERGVAATPEEGALPGTGGAEGASILASTGGLLPTAGVIGVLLLAAWGLIARRFIS